MNKDCFNEIVTLVAARMQKKPEVVEGAIRSMMSMSLEQLLVCPEIDNTRAATAKFRSASQALKEGVDTSSSRLDKKIESLRKKAEQLKKQKSKIGSRISEILANNGQPDDLYAEIYKVSEELRSVEDVIRLLERERAYPNTPKTQALGKAAFEAGAEAICANVALNKAAKAVSEKLTLAQYIMAARMDQIGRAKVDCNAINREHVKSYCHFHPDAVQLTWDELDRLVREEIEKKLKEGAI